jgi:hypothetical protein
MEKENPFEHASENDTKLRDLWRFGLYSIKVEIVLYDLRQSLYWQSMMEIGIMLSAFIALLSAHSLLFFMHLLHIIRPYLAFRIISTLPRTHILLEELPSDPTAAYKEAADKIVEQFKKSSVFYSHYLILSGISAAFDILALLYNLSNIGGTSDNNIFYVNIAGVFLAFDFFVLFWSKTLLFTFPKDLWNTSRDIANSTIRDTNILLNGMIQQVARNLK